MKTIKFSAFLLASGLFIASCGDGARNDDNFEDTTMMDQNMEQTMPENGTDTAVNIDNTTSMNQGYNNQGDTPSRYNEELPKNSTDESTVGKPTKNPGKSPSTGHPDRAPEKTSSSSPSM